MGCVDKKPARGALLSYEETYKLAKRLNAKQFENRPDLLIVPVTALEVASLAFWAATIFRDMESLTIRARRIQDIASSMLP